MSRFFTYYIYILFFIVFSNGISSQNLILKISSKDESEKKFLKSVNFQKKHPSEEYLYKEVDLISEKLKQVGYFLNTVDSISKKNTNYTSYFSLKTKTEKAVISIPFEEIEINTYIIKDNKVSIPIEELPGFLTSISNQLDRQGKSFSEVKLKNIILKEKLLFAELDIYESKKRTIDRIIVKGYETFSKNYLKRFLYLKKGTLFNQQKLEEISTSINSLDFVSEVKPPEVLFSKDSTLLYLYLKKKQANNFDGLLNFSSKENSSGLLFNGHLDLKLNNILNSGEQLELFWKANGEERQSFNVSTEIPYVFNSPVTSDISFSIYKQDSTFLNTKFHTGISYSFNSKIKITTTLDSETSKNTLQNNNNQNVQDFNNTFFGLLFNYRITNNDSFFNDKFNITINPSFGKRESEDFNNSQFKINIEALYLWEFNQRNSIFIKNKTGYLNSDNFIDNELYRIGGANSIRGFNEQSIFTSQFSFFNIEYRYLTSRNSYLYTITDLGRIKTQNSNNENLYGLGFGYLFSINNSQINLAYVIGKNDSSSFDFKQSKLTISLKSFF